MKKTRHILTALAVLVSIMTMTLPASAIERVGGIPVVRGKLEEHTAQEGEDLYPIAKKYGLAIEHLMFANGLPGIETKVGQKLIIPTRRIPPSITVKNGIILNLPERGLFFFNKEKIEKFYPVAIGAEGKWMTPTGDMKVINMAKNPTWLPPEWAKEEEPVPAGPDNPLGDRWMGLNEPGLGIHATNNPVSIGLAASHGCIRMYPEMAHDLYEKVYIDMPVKIIYEPVKIGYDPDKKQIFLEVYPDVYEKTDGLLYYAQVKLAEHNLLGLVDEDRLKYIISRKRGIPELLIGSDINVKVDNQFPKLSLTPITKDGATWVTSEVLKDMGVTVLWNNKNKTVDIYQGKKKVSLAAARKEVPPPPPKKEKKEDGKEDNGNYEKKVEPASTNSVKAKPEGPVAYLWEGRTIIPLGHVLKGLGIAYSWNPDDRTIYIYSGRKNVNKNSKPAAKPSPSPSPAPPSAPAPAVVPDDIP